MQKTEKSIVIKTVTGSEVNFTHKAERPSNYFSSSFTHYLAEQLKKGVKCVQILLEIRQIEPKRVCRKPLRY